MVVIMLSPSFIVVGFSNFGGYLSPTLANHNLNLFSIHEFWIPLVFIPLYILSSSVDVAYILKVHVIFNPLSIILVSEPLILIF